MSGDLGGEMAQHADKFVTGFIRTFENNYSRFEQAVKQAVCRPAVLCNSSMHVDIAKQHTCQKRVVSVLNGLQKYTCAHC